MSVDLGGCDADQCVEPYVIFLCLTPQKQFTSEQFTSEQFITTHTPHRYGDGSKTLRIMIPT